MEPLFNHFLIFTYSFVVKEFVFPEDDVLIGEAEDVAENFCSVVASVFDESKFLSAVLQGIPYCPGILSEARRLYFHEIVHSLLISNFTFCRSSHLSGAGLRNRNRPTGPVSVLHGLNRPAVHLLVLFHSSCIHCFSQLLCQISVFPGFISEKIIQLHGYAASLLVPGL